MYRMYDGFSIQCNFCEIFKMLSNMLSSSVFGLFVFFSSILMLQMHSKRTCNLLSSAYRYFFLNVVYLSCYVASHQSTALLNGTNVYQYCGLPFLASFEVLIYIFK